MLLRLGCAGLIVQTAYLQYLYAESLQSREQVLQCRLVLKRAVQDGLDGLDVCRQIRKSSDVPILFGKPVEIEQRLWRKDSCHADLVLGRWHGAPSGLGN